MSAYELAIERANNPYLDPEANAQDFKVLAEALRHQADYIKHLEEGLESALALNKAQAGRGTNHDS
jgi:hypothetical protein